MAGSLLLPRFITSQSDYLQDDFRPFINTSAQALATEIVALKKVSGQYKTGSGTLKQLQAQLTATRNAYKSIEAVLEYYYPRHCKAYLNGPPLNHLDPFPVKEQFKSDTYYVVAPGEYGRSIPLDQLDTDHYRGDRRVIAPVGLQALDELVSSEEAADNKEEILRLASQLEETFLAVQVALEKRNYFYDFEMAEAARLELVRILSLGISGFDTPGSLNALPETAVALQGTQKLLEPILQKATRAQQQQTQALYKGAITYLAKHNNFEKFDRLDFLTQYLNPLYKVLGEMQKEQGMQSSAERWGKTPSWNAYSTNIFDADFLNPYFYSLLRKEDDCEALRQLGRQLFYDSSLSGNGQMNCASCHKPEQAFTDGQKTSLANKDGKRVLRNSPSLINAVFSDRFFYDLRAYDLEDQAGHVIENHLEFNTTFDAIVAKLKANEKYKEEFEAVFGKKEISRYQFSSALASYVISLCSFNSPFDQYVQGKIKTIDPKVKQGFNLFMGKAACATCHYVPTFSGLIPPLYQENESEVLGVLQQPGSMMPDTDAGRINNGIPEDKEDIYRGSFKTTTVRNAKLTAPYFHNGAYTTLEEVIDFYNHGGAGGAGLGYEVSNQTLSPDSLNLSKKEIEALIAFINSLTDNPYGSKP
jgi:cytochrome c peroxidase